MIWIKRSVFNNLSNGSATTCRTLSLKREVMKIWILIGSAKPEKKGKPKSHYDKDKISREKPCELCNRPFHRGRNCPAKFSVCKACGEKGHWAKSPRCKKSSKSVGEVEQSDVEETDSLFLADDL